MSVSKLRFGRW